MTLRRQPISVRAFGVVMLGLAGCGSAQRPGGGIGHDPGAIIPRLFDPASVYVDMGFYAHGDPVPFVASVRFLATEHPDTTLAVFGLSLANEVLSFRRSARLFEARYRVEVGFRQAGTMVRRLASDEVVRVGTMQETLRADESVIYQEFVRLAAGRYVGIVTVRDRNGEQFASVEREIDVPRFEGRRLSSLVPVYDGTARTERRAWPRLLVNPRATAPYGLDTLRIYVEAYGVDGGTPITLTATARGGETVWRDTAYLEGNRDVATAIVELPPAQLPVGELVLSASLPGAEPVRASALVTFSDQWAITDFEDVLSLLRYFGEDSAVAAMRAAAPDARPPLWRRFWQATDPDPVTPEHEALSAYFSRIQTANLRFAEAGDPGWLTDRGEVFASLGEPDEVFDQSLGLQGQRRVIRWTYVTERLSIDFVDDTGFGRFRMTPGSRAEFMRARARRRSEH
ncbi:MAG TPA: GWxTD domain-containing protein [Gemmatimonadales bacterium]